MHIAIPTMVATLTTALATATTRAMATTVRDILPDRNSLVPLLSSFIVYYQTGGALHVYQIARYISLCPLWVERNRNRVGLKIGMSTRVPEYVPSF
jgi:hypothetical protein